MDGNTGTATNARPPDGGIRRRGARAGAAGRELGSADRAARPPRPPRSWDRWLLGGGRVATAELAPVGWAAHLVPRLGHVRWLRHRPRSAGLWGGRDLVDDRSDVHRLHWSICRPGIDAAPTSAR